MPHPRQESSGRLLTAGKPAKVALTATARKLLCLLNHQLKTTWLLPPLPSAK